MKIPLYSVEDMNYKDLVNVVIETTSANGDIRAKEWGTAGFVPSASGLLLIMEEKYVSQLDKFKLSMDEYFKPQLTLKDGENFVAPQESELDKRQRELEEEMRKIQMEQYKKENNLDTNTPTP